MAQHLIFTRLDGTVAVTTPSPALVMEFHLFGRPTGTLLWSGPPIEMPTSVMPLTDAAAAALNLVRELDIPGGTLYETHPDRRLDRKRLLMTPLADEGFGLTRAEADARLAAEATTAQNSVAESTTSELVTAGILDPVTKHHGRFRNACVQDPARVCAVSMPLARIQRMNEVRMARTPRLAKCDDDIRTAQDAGNTTKEAALRTYRQALRDIPATEKPNVDAITTPAELAAWVPAWPKDPVP